MLIAGSRSIPVQPAFAGKTRVEKKAPLLSGLALLAASFAAAAGTDTFSVAATPAETAVGASDSSRTEEVPFEQIVSKDEAVAVSRYKRDEDKKGDPPRYLVNVPLAKPLDRVDGEVRLDGLRLELDGKPQRILKADISFRPKNRLSLLLVVEGELKEGAKLSVERDTLPLAREGKKVGAGEVTIRGIDRLNE